MITVNVLLILAASIAVISTLLSMASLFFFTRRRKGLPDYTPPITIYKPLKGMDEGMEECLRSFFLLDYPTYQLLFGVANPDDPAIPVVKRLLAEFPDHDARLVVGTPAFGSNPKVENLAAMTAYRRHEVILISDSNIRVRPSYLRETACYLADPKVGLVSNVFSGVEEQRFGATVENLQLNGFIAGNVAAAAATGLVCVVGKSILMPQAVLEAIGGFSGVRNLLAEDQTLGVKVRKAGYQLRLSHHVIENVNRNRHLYGFLSRHSRWYKCRRHVALPLFLIEPTANLTTVGLVWALVGETGTAWIGLGFLCGLGIFRDAIQTKWLRGTYPKLRNLPLSLMKDLFLLPIWFDALFNPKIHWRGQTFVVGKGSRLRKARVPREVRKRMRRVRRLRERNM